MFGWFSKSKKEQQTTPKKQVEEVDIDEQKLEQDGIDPSQIPEEEVKEGVLADPNNFYQGYLTISEEEIARMVDQYKHFQKDQEQVRDDECAHHKGGRQCVDEVVQQKLRSVGKEIIKQIGKSIFSGSLTQISFPIKAMIPQTTLEAAVNASCLFPLYINKAVLSNDPLERMKLVITWTLSSFYWTNTFLKPLNPILGETLQARFNDGTQVYCEQISHHPPISYFLIIGQNNSYRYYGYYDYDASAGLNSVTVINKGQRTIEFPGDGTKINFDFPNEKYSGTLMGTLKQQSNGKMNFIDVKNNLRGEVAIGKVKKRPSDYIDGFIYSNDKPVSTVYGSYMGFLDFDDVRYWDYRRVSPCKLYLENSKLESNYSYRKDLNNLLLGDMVVAQKEKEVAEQIQRTDAQLRQKYAEEQQKLEKERKKQQKAASKK